MNETKLRSDAIDHAMRSIEDDSGPLIPFAMTLEDHPDPTRRQLFMQRFVSDDFGKMAEAAFASVGPAPGLILYAVAVDGFVTVDGVKFDAILVESGDRRQANMYAQRYEPRQVRRWFWKRVRNVRVGPPIYIGARPSRLADDLE